MILDYVKNVLGLGTGHERTKKAKKNIFVSFLLKGTNIALGLIIMPITINYLSSEKFGIWVTLTSIVAWFGFFDIGLGGGLRNRFAEAIASGKHNLARVYVSTTYAILSLIMGGILFLFFIINPYLNWSIILNVNNSIVSGKELSLLAAIVFSTFSINFVLRLITTILTADQRPALASVFDLLGKFLSLVVIIILVATTKESLLYLGIARSMLPVLVLLVSTFWFFNGRYKKYRPSINMVEFSRARDLFSLGIKFFVLNIAVVLLYQTNNIVISQLFGASQVTPYNVAFRYFSVLTMGFSIVVVPFWSAITDAWIKKEIDWIRNIIKSLVRIWFVILLLGVIMVLSSQLVFHYWVGDKVNVPIRMSILVCIWVVVNAWNMIYSHFLNGVGRLKLQMYLGLFGAILNIPLAIFLGKTLGVEGILIANILVVLPGVMVYPIQYRKIINSSATGIWNK